MPIEKAFLILGIGRDATLKRLNARFRTLAKRYHPDSTGDDPRAAHEKMTDLNLAYETIRRHLMGEEPGEVAADERTGPPQEHTRAYPPHRKPHSDQAVSAALKAALLSAVEEIRDAVYLYYQYGLENVHQRREGVGRFRYRDAVRKLAKGISGLEKILPLFEFTAQEKIVRSFHSFSRAFLANMALSRYQPPSSRQDETRAYRHYTTASRYLDLAIRDVFCRELAPRGERNHYTPETFKLIDLELMTVITRFYSTSWITETLVKVDLLEKLIKDIPIISGWL